MTDIESGKDTHRDRGTDRNTYKETERLAERQRATYKATENERLRERESTSVCVWEGGGEVTHVRAYTDAHVYKLRHTEKDRDSREERDWGLVGGEDCQTQRVRSLLEEQSVCNHSTF